MKDFDFRLRCIDEAIHERMYSPITMMFINEKNNELREIDLLYERLYYIALIILEWRKAHLVLTSGEDYTAEQVCRKYRNLSGHSFNELSSIWEQYHYITHQKAYQSIRVRVANPTGFQRWDTPGTVTVFPPMKDVIRNHHPGSEGDYANPMDMSDKAFDNR